MIVYLDTSTVLRALLQDGPVLDDWGTWKRAYSSELLGVEARRAIDRLRLTGTIDDDGVVAATQSLEEIERGIGRIALNRAVLRRAGQPMRTVVRTLDAIHVASALLLQERRDTTVVFATHDSQQAAGAKAFGFSCIGTDLPGA